MNTTATDTRTAPASLSVAGAGAAGGLTAALRRQPELFVLAALLLLCNLPLGGTAPAGRWGYSGAALAAGEWWRLLTFPLAHVSLYHLLLDAGAFAGLYLQWRQCGVVARLFLLALSQAGSLALARLAVVDLPTLGLCGLSGPAHGLLALVALECALASGDRRVRFAGWGALGAVTLKAAAEAATGQVLFAGAHLGDIGVPVAACHAGGIVGALAGWLLLRAWPAPVRHMRRRPPCVCHDAPAREAGA